MKPSREESMGPLTNTNKARPWSETLSRGYLSAVMLLLLGWGAPASATEGQIRVQWLGQSAFKITTLRYLKPRFVIPMHYGTIPVLRGTPREYIHALGDTHTKVFANKPGDELSFCG